MIVADASAQSNRVMAYWGRCCALYHVQRTAHASRF